MAGRIQGITVEIGGDTTKLSSALQGVNKEIKSTQSQLKDVEKLLKLDPSNTELLSQKQKLLTQAISETKEKLATLKTVFKENGTVTAGNACGRNDGASVVLLMSGRKVRELGIKPQAKLIGYSTAGVDPRVMGIGPVPAVRKVLKQLDMTIDQMDLIELNEAFAAQVLACVNELGIDQEKLNVNGGAIAIGHPAGCTGARMVMTLCNELHRRPEAKYDLATMCVAGGFGSAVVMEKV
jgi:acetyl-CoA C-acetyltransferase